jgi:hypothetical protein
MAELDNILAEIVVGSLAGPHTWCIAELVNGESTDWKLNALKKCVEFHDYQSGTADVTMVMEYLRTRIPTLSGHIKARNRLTHSVWSPAAKKDGQFTSVQYRRHSDPVEIVQSVDGIERFGDSLEREVHILSAVANVIILSDPIVIEKLGKL